MVIQFDPIVYSFGFISVRWFGVFSLIGVLLGTILTLTVARRQGIDREYVLCTLAWGLPAGIATARLFHVVSGWDYYLTRPDEILQVPLDGLSLWGGLLGGGLVAGLRLRAVRSLRIRLADVATLGLLLAIVLGRVGSFLNGDGQGLASDLPWATLYTHPYTTVPDFIHTRHPTQVYDGLAALFLLALLSRVPVTAPPGTRFWSFLALYGVAGIAIGELGLEPPFIFGLQLDQLLAATAVLFSLVQLSVTYWRRPVRHPLPAASPTMVQVGFGE
jgi:phosphatidylglycerol---prolipoprotein diacylglyceryl transferase